MSFFDKIKNAIFGKAEAAPQASAPTATTASPAAPAQPAAPAPAATASASTSNVDVASILDAAVKQNGQKLDWKRSIVDLLKALNLDSSLTARKELAGELGYTGDTSDSATMNIWLHKAVIKKLSENGGKVPADLLD
jgi:3-oxoacyl-ACP reductase-like protein